ncbi:hypothetical protein TNCV_784221 [Trichonephila clavipes]|nr:hypothetical protein TNCV_784221 [Trichonephila clavipes]
MTLRVCATVRNGSKFEPRSKWPVMNLPPLYDSNDLKEILRLKMCYKTDFLKEPNVRSDVSVRKTRDVNKFVASASESVREIWLEEITWMTSHVEE